MIQSAGGDSQTSRLGSTGIRSCVSWVPWGWIHFHRDFTYIYRYTDIWYMDSHEMGWMTIHHILSIYYPYTSIYWYYPKKQSLILTHISVPAEIWLQTQLGWSPVGDAQVPKNPLRIPQKNHRISWLMLPSWGLFEDRTPLNLLLVNHNFPVQMATIGEPPLSDTPKSHIKLVSWSYTPILNIIAGHHWGVHPQPIS